MGTLLPIATCVRPGRRFVARLINLISQDDFPVILDFEFSLDISWWLHFMDQYNGVSLIQDSPWSLPDAVLSTDACLSGCGGFYQGRYFHALFPDEILQSAVDINTLELMTLAVALKLWAPTFNRQKLVVACDNMQAVTAINTGRSSSQLVQRILRDIWFFEARFDFSVRAIHIAGVDNRIADHLSRWDLADQNKERFFELAADYQLVEYSIPRDLFTFDTEYTFY